MAISYVYTGQPMNGTDNDDFVIAFKGSTGTDDNTIFGNGGDDWVMADSSDTWIPGSSYLNGSIANAFSLETLTSTWTTGENPMFGDDTIPHTTAVVEATVGQSEFFAVTIGAGQQITIDLDFASNTPIGSNRDLVVELQDAQGNIVATADDSLVSDGGLGSTPSTAGSTASYDPYLVYTAAAAGTYYINVRPFGGGPGSTFTENNTFVMNVSVTGHVTAAANPVQGNDLVDGGDGDDFLMGAGGSDTIRGGAGNDTISGGSGVDTLAGGLDDDIIYGGDGTEESVHGDEGNDTLYSGGEGHYYGDTGDDLIYAGVTSGVNEVLDGGDGIDTLDTRTWNGTYVINLDAGTTNFGESFTNFENVITGNGADMILGTAAANLIVTNGGADSIDGGAGDDTMQGGTGDDSYYVDSAGDVVVELAGEGTDTVYSSASYVLSAEVENLTLTGSAANGAGNALANLLVGDNGKNTLNGKGGADTMQGGVGDDTYRVDDAGDVVIETAGQGSDRVLSTVDYTLAAGQSIEVLSALQTASTTPLQLTGNEIANNLIGNAGANTLDGGAGADTMKGAAGNDIYVVDDTGDRVIEAAGQGTDTVRSSVNHTLASNVENLILTGAGDINGRGNTLANTLSGNAGANILDGKEGVDTLQGGAGDDTYVVDSAADVVVELAGEGTDTVQSSVSYSLAANLENLTQTGSGNLKGTGNTLGNVLRGNAGANILNGMQGADTLKGGAGDDTYVVDNAGDVVIEASGEGTDLVQSSISFALSSNVEELSLIGTANVNATGNSVANRLTGNSGNNVLDGKQGADTLRGGDGDDTYVVDNVSDVIIEGAAKGTDTVQSSITYTLGYNLENLTLTGSGNLNGTGNAQANMLIGNAGDNLLDGDFGADTMKGGAGNDTYVVDNVFDSVVEAAAAGTDTVQSSISFTLGSNVEQLMLTGGLDINGTGNTLANTILGNTGNNLLDGGGGADHMEGGVGNDTYVVDNAGDSILEVAGQGTDTVQASVNYALGDDLENLVLSAAGNIRGTGNVLANQIIGNAGNNLIDGGLGKDTLTGGAGQDTFLFDTALGAANVDTVVDFDVPNDTIRLDRTIFAALTTTGTLAASAFVIGSTATTADQHVIYNAANGSLFYDADGAGGAAATKFAQLATGLSLTHNDFTVVA